VLDNQNFSPIIYIWYEGGELRPSLVRLENTSFTLLHLDLFGAAQKVPRATGGGDRVSVPGGSYHSD
jgi:hypothetical protein